MRIYTRAMSDTDSSDCVQTSVISEAIMFPTVKKNSINSKAFLTSCFDLLKVIDQVGSYFAPVRHDLARNLSILKSVHERDEELYENLEDILMHEAISLQHSGSVALLSIMRYTEFVTTVLNGVTKGLGKTKFDLVDTVRFAYRDVLMMHQCWMMEQLISIICRLPTNSQHFMTGLGLGPKDKKQEEVLGRIKKYCTRADRCLRKLYKFYREYGLSDIEEEDELDVLE